MLEKFLNTPHLIEDLIPMHVPVPMNVITASHLPKRRLNIKADHPLYSHILHDDHYLFVRAIVKC